MTVLMIALNRHHVDFEISLDEKYLFYFRQKLKDANDELQKKKTYMESLEPRTNATGKGSQYYIFKIIRPVKTLFHIFHL